MQPATWRLIQTKPASGPWNMAVDETLLEMMGSTDAQPVLRLYAWNPPCLSIGYAQSIANVNRNHLTNLGWELVRRPTGGRAILHTDELTYAVIGPHTDLRLTGGVLESYRRLSGTLVIALTKVGLPVQALPHPKNQSPTSSEAEPICFEQPSNYEITVHGKKLIGSAQARKKAGILQHGTLPLYGDLTRITQVLTFDGEEQRAIAAQRLLARAATVEHVLNKPITWKMAADAFIAAFAETLHLTLIPTNLTPDELARAEVLVKEKYALPQWTERI